MKNDDMHVKCFTLRFRLLVSYDEFNEFNYSIIQNLHFQTFNSLFYILILYSIHMHDCILLFISHCFLYNYNNKIIIWFKLMARLYL